MRYKQVKSVCEVTGSSHDQASSYSAAQKQANYKIIYAVYSVQALVNSQAKLSHQQKL